MKVYILIEDSGYEGENDVIILGIFSTPEKAKEKFIERVYWAKYDFGQFVEDEENDEEEFIADEGWEFEETETNFWAQEITRSSRNWVNIWIAEEKVK